MSKQATLNYYDEATNISKKAWEMFKKNLGKRQLQIFRALRKLGEANNYMIAREIPLPINSVTPRVLELRNKGLVEGCGLKHGQPSGNLCMFWKCSGKLEVDTEVYNGA